MRIDLGQPNGSYVLKPAQTTVTVPTPIARATWGTLAKARKSLTARVTINLSQLRRCSWTFSNKMWLSR